MAALKMFSRWLKSRGALWAGLAFVWLAIVGATLYPAWELTRYIYDWTDCYYPGAMPLLQVRELWMMWLTYVLGMFLAGVMTVGYGVIELERRDHVENKSQARLPADTG